MWTFNEATGQWVYGGCADASPTLEVLVAFMSVKPRHCWMNVRPRHGTPSIPELPLAIVIEHVGPRGVLFNPPKHEQTTDEHNR